MKLGRITTNWFVGGYIYDDCIISCAPILKKFISNKTINQIVEFCNRKRWEHTIVDLPDKNELLNYFK